MSDVSARKGKKDQYANVAYGIVAQTVINTLAFSQVQFAVGLFQGIALLIHRISWYPYAGVLREIVAATDSLSMALCTSNRITGIGDITDPAIIAMHHIYGIGVAVANEKLPMISDFSMLPGGGKLVAANPLFFAVNTGGFAAVATFRAQIDFSFIELADRDYLEVIQASFPSNI